MAISERSRQRKELGRVPGVLESTSSYVVSKKQAQESKAGKGFGSKNSFIPVSSMPASGGGGEGLGPTDGDALHTVSGEATKTTTIFAFRLLANLAYADGARGRIMGFGGLTLAAAAAVSSAADEITHRSRRSVTNSNSSRNIGTSAAAAAAGCAVEAAGEAAAALLHRLSPVLGAEGSEDQLVAAGEALSAAVHAVSTASRSSNEQMVPPVGNNGKMRAGIGLMRSGGGSVEVGAQEAGVGVVDTDTMGNLRGLVTEALSALLVLSWSDAVNLEAAAAIDWVITDAALVSSVVSLWRQGMMPPPPSPFGSTSDVDFSASSASAVDAAYLRALSSMALPFLSSVAHRQAGRSSLVAADFPSSIFSVVLQETTAAMAATMDGGPEATGEPERGLLLLSIAERAELLSLICVLCASPTHRAVVRASLLSSTSVASGNETGGSGSGAPSSAGTGGGFVYADDSEESEAAMEAQLVRLQGDNSQSSWECRSNIARLASLLGLSPPRPQAAVASTPGRPSSECRHEVIGPSPAAPVHLSAPRAQPPADRHHYTSESSREDEGKAPMVVTNATTVRAAAPNAVRSVSPPAVPIRSEGFGGREGSGGREARELGTGNSGRDVTAVYPTVRATVATVVGTAVPHVAGVNDVRGRVCGTHVDASQICPLKLFTGEISRVFLSLPPCRVLYSNRQTSA